MEALKTEIRKLGGGNMELWVTQPSFIKHLLTPTRHQVAEKVLV